MRILHTADWHLGRQYNDINMQEDQQATLDEINDICEKKQIDVVLVAGDIFNGINTPGYADEMFINSIIKMANNGKRAIIAISGNNDEGTRFAASQKFAERQNIYLIKNRNYDVEESIAQDFPVKLIGSGVGYLKFKKNNEILTIVYFPYSEVEKLNNVLLKTEDVVNEIKAQLALGEIMFEEKGEGLNFGIAHIGLRKSQAADPYHDEISGNVFSDKYDYVALGHRHTMYELEEGTNVYYAGSTSQTYLDEDSNKYVIIINTENNLISTKEFVKLKTPKKLIEIKPKNYEDCKEQLEKLSNSYVEITFDSESISSANINKIKNDYNFITKFNLIPKIKKNRANEKSLKRGNPDEIFSEFYEKTIGRKPTKELVETFLEVFKGDSTNEAD